MSKEIHNLTHKSRSGGDARNVQFCTGRITDADFHIAIHDMQADAHKFARAKPGNIGDKGQNAHGTMFRKMSKFAALGTCGLVTADGLFVPLNDEKAGFFIHVRV